MRSPVSQTLEGRKTLALRPRCPPSHWWTQLPRGFTGPPSPRGPLLHANIRIMLCVPIAVLPHNSKMRSRLNYKQYGVAIRSSGIAHEARHFARDSSFLALVTECVVVWSIAIQQRSWVDLGPLVIPSSATQREVSERNVFFGAQECESITNVKPPHANK
jgi:hypothetical protein